jgi:hypothetical protein
MSNYISAIRLHNYEDNDHYGQTSCTLKHWPDLWPEEMAADGALYRERMRQKQQTFFMARDDAHRTIQYFKNLGAKRFKMDDLARCALLSLAEWNGWKVKNGGNVRLRKVTPIIATRHCEYEELEDIEDFMSARQRLKRIKRTDKLTRKQLVKIALLSLIDEQGWQRVEQHPRRNITIYHYKV